MKLSEFKEKGYRIEETAYLYSATFSIDLDDIEEITSGTILSGEAIDFSYADENSTYNIIDAYEDEIYSDLSSEELIEKINEL